MKIQKELDETKIVLHKTIESVLERGEKIDTLVAKSNDLSGASKQFYKQVSCRHPWMYCYVRCFIFRILIGTIRDTGKRSELVLYNHVDGFLGCL